MRIGITCDLKSDLPAGAEVPDDYQEEFDSPATVDAVTGALRGCGHTVEVLGEGRALLTRLLSDPPEFVFNFAEGHGVGRSREARVPALLEMLDIPYTGSDPLTLAATLDKDVARRLAESVGLLVPHGAVARSEEDLARIEAFDVLPHGPWIVKPAWEGSSKGIRGKCVVDTPAQASAAIARLLRTYQQPVLYEEYIAGDELTVGVIGNDSPTVIGVMRVCPREANDRFVYSLEVKRDWRRQVRYECPPKLPATSLAAVERAALTAFHGLGCRDVARIDFRLRDGVPYFLEANPLPGLNPESSDLVILANLAGWRYERLIAGILNAALARQGYGRR